jgi:hypothetical protein
VQIEFTGLLATLLQSSSAPLLHPKYDLNGLQEFLLCFPSDTSLHQDYPAALSTTLSHLELNCRELVSKFAWKLRDSLVGIWTTKNRGTKGVLVAILETLFPHVSISKFGLDPDESKLPTEGTYGDGFAKLWHTLDAEAESSGVSSCYRRIPYVHKFDIRVTFPSTQAAMRSPIGRSGPFGISILGRRWHVLC